MVYLTLDDRDVRERAASDPEGLLASLGGGGVVIDEIQRSPELLLALKAIIDREQRNGRFLLTGSNQPRVSKDVAESLLGRVAYRTLRPLTLSEQRYDDGPRKWSWFFALEEKDLLKHLEESAQLGGELPWRESVAAGGMPRAIAASPRDREQVLDDYLRTFAERDIQEVVSIERPERFRDFLRLAAARTGQELNAASISRDLGVSPNTIQRWVSALERSYLVNMIQPYSRNPSQRVIKAPKLFMADSGMALAGAGEHTPTGFHLETLVANDLYVWRDEVVRRAVFHWRLQSGQEVDFVLQEDQALVPIEVKTKDTVERHDIRHLKTFLERHSEAPRAILLTSDPIVRAVADRVIAAPWWAVL
jgi:predicted AAA+ superfamily ATPase